MIQRLLALSIGVALLHCCSTIHAQHIPLCESLNDADAQQNDPEYSEVKIRRVRAICDAIYSSQSKAEERDLNTIPEFDLTQIQSDQDAEHILRRFRRRGGRGGGSSGGRSGGGSRSGSSGGRFSFGSRSSSSSGSRSSFFGSRSSSSSSSSSSSGSRIFSRGSSSSSSGSGSSRIFSRGASSSSSSGTGSSGSRIFSRSSGSSSSSGGAGSSRIFSRSSGSSGTPAQRSSIRIFSRNPSSSNTGSRIREAVRTLIHKPSSSAGSGTLPGAGGTRVISGPKPSLSDKIRKITHSGGGGGSGMFGGGSSGISGGSGSSAWVRAGKKFLPHAVRFGKRYYQRRKYTTGMYAGMGGGAGYYAGSRMNHHGHVYQNSYYGYPPVVDQVPDQIEGQAPTVFYCIQEDLNATLVNETLSAEGVGTCNISGKLVTCPIEIECKLSEADNCCEDELGTPYCCGGPIPVEYATEYGGYGDDAEDAAETLHQMLNVFTATCALLATICLTMWQRRGE